MSDRLKSMKRLLRVQDQVKRLAEAELASAEGRKAAIEATAVGLDGFIGDPDCNPRLVQMAMGQRRLLAVRHTNAERAVSEHLETTREARSRFRLAERMIEDLGRDEARAEERKDLERLIEGMVGRDPDPSASLP